MQITRVNDKPKCCFSHTKVSDFMTLTTDGSSSPVNIKIKYFLRMLDTNSGNFAVAPATEVPLKKIQYF